MLACAGVLPAPRRGPISGSLRSFGLRLGHRRHDFFRRILVHVSGPQEKLEQDGPLELL
jgi:hypothetical protein